jgi:hypothetical protein
MAPVCNRLLLPQQGAPDFGPARPQAAIHGVGQLDVRHGREADICCIPADTVTKSANEKRYNGEKRMWRKS